jgi:hypothetical protein
MDETTPSLRLAQEAEGLLTVETDRAGNSLVDYDLFLRQLRAAAARPTDKRKLLKLKLHVHVRLSKVRLVARLSPSRSGRMTSSARLKTSRIEWPRTSGTRPAGDGCVSDTCPG